MPTNYEMGKYLYYVHTTVYYDGNEYTVFHVLHPPLWTDGCYKPDLIRQKEHTISFTWIYTTGKNKL